MSQLFFPVPRVKIALDHLCTYRGVAVLVPLVLAANGVGEEKPAELAETDTWFDRFLAPSLLDLDPGGGKQGTLTPAFAETQHVAGDLLVLQRQRLWANRFSVGGATGYRGMLDRGEVARDEDNRWILKPTFWTWWEGALPETFRFEELLVLLHAFSGFDSSVQSWGSLLEAFSNEHVVGGSFPNGWDRRFKVSGEVKWDF